jgi:hypothetical protein
MRHFLSGTCLDGLRSRATGSERSRFWKKVASPTRRARRGLVIRPKLDKRAIVHVGPLHKARPPARAPIGAMSGSAAPFAFALRKPAGGASAFVGSDKRACTQKTRGATPIALEPGSAADERARGAAAGGDDLSRRREFLPFVEASLRFVSFSSQSPLAAFTLRRVEASPAPNAVAAAWDAQADSRPSNCFSIRPTNAPPSDGPGSWRILQSAFDANVVA